jgi:hypothetical protein
VRALIEEVIGAIAMAEVVELPWLGDSAPIPNRLLINKHFDGPKVPCEVAHVSIRLGELRRRDLALDDFSRASALSLELSYRFVYIVELSLFDFFGREMCHDLGATEEVRRIARLSSAPPPQILERVLLVAAQLSVGAVDRILARNHEVGRCGVDDAVATGERGRLLVSVRSFSISSAAGSTRLA